MTHRPMGPPVSFTLVAQSPLQTTTGPSLRSWVGIRPGNILLFANQVSGVPDANLEVYQLGSSISQQSGWDLLSQTCPDCPAAIKNVNLGTDNVLTSSSMFFVAKPKYAKLTEPDGALSSETINKPDSELARNFRPFVSPNSDAFVFQIKSSDGDISQINFYTSPTVSSPALMAKRTNSPQTTYYAVGDLEGKNKIITDNQMLIFEENTLRGAYRFDFSLNPYLDQALTNSLNKALADAAGNNPFADCIRGAFIGDFNNDGYIDLIYARKNKIYVTSYDPSAPGDSRFKNWPSLNLTIDSAETTVTLSAADLNNDGYPELAIETNNPHAVYFYLNNQK